MNFRKLALSPDVAPLSAALDGKPGLWSMDTFWKDFPIPVFREVDTIYLRFPDKGAFRRGVGDVNVADDQPALEMLPEARSLLGELVRGVQGKEVGRVLINRLPPGAKVLAHSDGRNLYYSRFHIVLDTNSDVEFRCGDEFAYMNQGEVWWFDNSVEHEVINRGETPRIHLIADIRT